MVFSQDGGYTGGRGKGIAKREGTRESDRERGGESPGGSQPAGGGSVDLPQMVQRASWFSVCIFV